ncbi:MAG: crotonase/enoyl-CoA hydratase family protein [Acidimicrobiia bacterium]
MLDVEILGRTAVLTLNRPEARNAIDGETATALEAAVDRIEADDEVWTAVLTGAGGMFSAGADLKVLSAGRDKELFTKRGNFGGFVLLPRTKPVIAAVEGPALAGGCELAHACDLIVSSTTARFGLPEVKRSLVAAAGGLARLPRVLPPQVAAHMLLTGDPIDGQRAYDLGMVCELTQPGGALEAALALASKLNANAPLAVRHTARILREAADRTFDETFKEGRAAIRELLASDDYRGGPRAFVEKRAPVWTGK